MKVIGYARVSTDRQDLSLDIQAQKIRAMASVKDAELTDLFVDNAESGKDLNRPGAQKVMELVRAKRVNGVIIAKLDRLTRSVRDAVEIIDLFNRKKVALISVEESFDTSSIMGRAMVKIMTVFAEMERETIGARTSTAMQQMRKNGWTTGNPPYGWKSVGKKLPLEAVPEEQQILATMKKLRAKGKSLREIADELNRRGLKTRSGGEFRFQYIDGILRRSQ